MSKTVKQAKSKTKITRIKAGEKPAAKTKTSQKSINSTTKIKTIKQIDKTAVVESAPVAQTEPKAKKIKSKTSRKNPIKRFGRYIKGSFAEIKMVKWPTRKEAWKMTFAVLFYSALIVAIVLLLDNLYAWLFKLIIR